MAEYIEREALLKEARQNKAIAACLADIVDVQDLINSQPAADVVSKEQFERIRWERDFLQKWFDGVTEERNKFFKYLADAIGCPCNFSPIDEEMREFCGDTCQSNELICWRRVFEKAATERQADNA